MGAYQSSDGDSEALRISRFVVREICLHMSSSGCSLHVVHSDRPTDPRNAVLSDAVSRALPYWLPTFGFTHDLGKTACLVRELSVSDCAFLTLCKTLIAPRGAGHDQRHGQHKSIGASVAVHNMHAPMRWMG